MIFLKEFSYLCLKMLLAICKYRYTPLPKQSGKIGNALGLTFAARVFTTTSPLMSTSEASFAIPTILQVCYWKKPITTMTCAEDGKIFPMLRGERVSVSVIAGVCNHPGEVWRLPPFYV
jgi:hypothetical protein